MLNYFQEPSTIH